MPRNVQKDPEASLTWTLKDEIMGRGKVYYAKLARGKSMFLAPRVVPYFNAVWGMRKADEARRLSRDARADPESAPRGMGNGAPRICVRNQACGSGRRSPPPWTNCRRR